MVIILSLVVHCQIDSRLPIVVSQPVANTHTIIETCVALRDRWDRAELVVWMDVVRLRILRLKLWVERWHLLVDIGSYGSIGGHRTVVVLSGICQGIDIARL